MELHELAHVADDLESTFLQLVDGGAEGSREFADANVTTGATSTEGVLR